MPVPWVVVAIVFLLVNDEKCGFAFKWRFFRIDFLKRSKNRLFVCMVMEMMMPITMAMTMTMTITMTMKCLTVMTHKKKML
jgi:hypothetical protein